MKHEIKARIRDKIIFLYGDDTVAVLIQDMLDSYSLPAANRRSKITDPMLIAYGDHLQAPDKTPLQALHLFAQKYLRGLIGGIHLLPFYPYTSDDGFSVVDFRTVDHALGDWSDIEALQQDFSLMFDLVLNHVSVASDWFQRFLRNEAPYTDYFITLPPDTDLSAVVRPRTHPLLTPFATATGTRYVWTTFSTDQVDLNYANPQVLLEIIRILLEYVQHGVDFIRLDAVAFLWKIPGTNCIHLPQTHVIIQLLRDVLEATAPWVKLITETNVPHHENILYFGNGDNEAHLVYQFALPPLLLHAFYAGNATVLSQWASNLQTPSTTTAFFNFAASHDGIGVRPVTELLKPADIDMLINTVKKHQGQISYRANNDGSQSPYELNTTFFDALTPPDEPLALSIDRFIASQAIMLVLSGLPAIYLPSLFGAANWLEGLERTGRVRTLNREKFRLDELMALLEDPNSRYGQVFQRYRNLLYQRHKCSAFAEASQLILNLHPSVFTVQRNTLLALHNVCNQAVHIQLPDHQPRRDLLSGLHYETEITLQPYQVYWLETES